MCGSMFYTWGGAGNSWAKPGAPGTSIITANIRDRDYPIDYGLSSRIQSGGAQNRADYSGVSAAVRHEGVESKKNLK